MHQLHSDYKFRHASLTETNLPKEASFVSNKNDKCDPEDDFENDDHIRLNRKRNIPIRKSSFKRKTNKSLSDDKLLTSDEQCESPSFNTSHTNLVDHTHPHRQLIKLSSDSNMLLTSTSSLSAFSSSGYNTNSDSASSFQKLKIFDHNNESANSGQFFQQQYHSQQISPCPIKMAPDSSQHPLSSSNTQAQIRLSTVDDTQSVGAIQKAKATFKNIMGKSSNNEISKRLLKQTQSVKSRNDMDSIYSGNPNNASLPDLGLQTSVESENSLNSFPSGYSSSSHLDIQHPQLYSNSPNASIGLFNKLSRSSQDSNFTLLSSHSIRKENHFKSGEICAICEDSIMMPSTAVHHSQTQSHFKCEDCKQLFHNKCIHLSSDIPCCSISSTGSSSNVLSGNIIHLLLLFT